ncbi:MAG: restriction endonuclease subunit S, partial [Flavisolibacter sp.]
MEWGTFNLKELFGKSTRGKRLKSEDRISGTLPFVTAGEKDEGISAFIGNDVTVFSENTTTIDMFGSAKYRNYKYGADDHVAVVHTEKLPKFASMFITTAIHKSSHNGQFDYSRNFYAKDADELNISLPTKKNKIDFEFMESFITELDAERIAELEAYLLATGLKDYTLTAEEQQILQDFEKGKIAFDEFTYKSIFNKIVQGRRLKKDDQISGNIPFVMAGTTNTGVVNYISNPMASFPKNSITIDIFGNTFYRNYDFGAGDDTGVYWNDKREYSKEVMLFFSASMEKSISGKFDFGKKLRSSQSFNFKMKLPTQNNQPNFTIMETFISAIQKLVIKEVVLYAD